MEGVDVGLDDRICGAEEGVGLEVGDEAALVDERDAVAEVESFIEVVGDEEDGFLEAREKTAEHVLHLGAGEGIERAEGFVHQENCGFGGEGAGKADTLALPAGELMGMARGKVGRVEADGGKQFVSAGDALGAGAAFGFKNDGDVARDGEVGEEATLLNDVADATAQRDERRIAMARAVDKHVAGRGLAHAVDGAQQRGFAGAAAAEHGGGGACGDSECDAIKQQAAFGGRERYIAELEAGAHICAPV